MARGLVIETDYSFELIDFDIGLLFKYYKQKNNNESPALSISPIGSAWYSFCTIKYSLGTDFDEKLDWLLQQYNEACRQYAIKTENKKI